MFGLRERANVIAMAKWRHKDFMKDLLFDRQGEIVGLLPLCTIEK